jgi:gamma-glutamyl-gamma-aminobutyrate hydrolase PuuD
MIKLAVIFILLGLCLSATVPQSPVIGVYTQIDEYD